ncbi:tandem-95 repeat protein [Variovorax sp. 770b2]|uniref:tandem-95 repeat protein n=1 Tax=Variovorax sp. 770b2 TaxID=1566271 RepID=UPI0015A6D774|nr:Ig-like domain-containing protein [Variovorax sp. 770b2]
MALEARYMFDAAAVATGAEVLAAQAAAQQADAAIADAARQADHAPAPAAVPAAQPGGEDLARLYTSVDEKAQGGQGQDSHGFEGLGNALQLYAPRDDQGAHGAQIVFIDPGVSDVSTLLQGIDPSAEVIFLDNRSDGLSQIASALQGRTDIGAIHILSHGDPGELRLGNAVYDNAGLSARSADLAAIGRALGAEGDILLYGCDTAQGVVGAQFAHSLSRLTGADVAASVDLTGAARLGGNWNLEYRTGHIESRVVVDERTQALYDSTLDAAVNTGSGAVLAVYGRNIVSIDVTTGKATVVTSVPATVGGLAVGDTINAMSLNAPAGLIYYFDGNTATRALFAYDYINNTHILIDANITDAGSVVVPGEQGVSGGGAAFYNGAMYLGVENVGGTPSDSIFRLAFAADGRSITGTSVFVGAVAGGADWGDLAIDTANNALVSTGGGDAGGRLFVRWDLATGTQLTNVNYTPTATQISNGTNGALYALGGTTIQSINPTTGALISTTNVTTNGTTLIAGAPADGAGATAATGTIGDRIFDDNNGDGVFGAGDTGIANVTVQIVDDVNNNGIADAGERVLATDTTNATGNYLFTGVLPGAYVVRVTDANGVLGGSAPTNGAAFRAVSLATIGGSILTADFGYDKVPPVVDLNSGTVFTDIVTNGGFTGGGAGWTSTGATTFFNNHVEWSSDTDSGTLTQAGLTGLQSGPGANGAGQVIFGFGWNNGVPDTNASGVFTVSVGGVVYATITTGRSLLNPNIATIVYSNGASGPVSIVNTSPFNNWTYTDITINLPANVADSGSLVFNYALGTPVPSSDDVSIDNVRVLTSADATPGRDWSATFTEDGAPVSISDTDATVIDSDSANMVAAQIVLTNGQAGDLLRIGGVALANGATGTLNGLNYTVSVSGGVTIIDLSGSATKAVYASTIGAVTFQSTLQNPLGSPVRDITVTVRDGGLSSNVAHAFITVVPVNDAPVLGTGSSLAYTENGAPAAVNPSIVVSDVDNATLASGAVAITGNFAAGQDVLDFANVAATMGNIAGTYNAATGVMTLSSAGNTATTAQWQAALRAVQYSNSSDNPSTAARTVSYTVNDGALDSNAVTSTVNLAAVNDAPVLAGGTSVTYAENGAPTAVNGAVVVSDPDNATLASGTVAITGNFVAGQDVLSFTNVVATMGNIAGTYNAATGVMSLSSAGNSATTAQWQAALRAVQYANTSEDPSAAARTVTCTVNDGAANSNTVTSSVNVGPVNDAPVNTLPAGWTTNEETAVGITGLQIGDVDAGSGNLRVTLGVPGGILTAASGSGVTVTGSGTGTLVLEGTQASINAYLASAARPNYVPVANANGNVTLTMTTTDLGSTGAGGAQTDTDTAVIAITQVNDAPAGADRTVALNEDAAYTFSAADFPVTDANDTPANGLQSVIVATLPPAGQGVLRLNGAAVTAGQAIPAGSLGQLTFTPAANLNGAGLGSFTFQVVDNGGIANGGQNTDLSPNTFSFNIAAVNDAPVIAPDTASGTEETPVTGNVLANDSDVDGDPLTVTQFVVNGATFIAGQTATIAGVGTLAINANGSYTFTPAANYNGAVPAVTYTVSDGTAAATSTLALTITAVNDAPVNTLPTGWTTDEDTTVGITGLQINDVDAGASPMRVTLSVPAGSLTAASGSGVTVTGSGTGTLILEGTQAGINAYLASAARPNYVPVANANGSVTLTMTTSDLGNTGTGGTLTDTDTATIAITAVNDAPAGADRAVAINEDGTYTFSASDFPVTDAADTPANIPQSVVIAALPPAGQGVLRLNGVAVTAGQAIPAGSLGQLTFTPAAHVNGTGLGSFTFQVVDNGGTANGGQNTDQSPNTFSFNIAAVNDAPVGNPDTGTTAEESGLTGNVLANDTDVDGDPLSVTQFVVNGATFTAGQTATLAGVGTLVIAANGSYTFTPAANYSGPVPAVTYTVSDGTATATSTLALTITAVNDAPVNTLPAGWTTDEDTTVGITGLQINDVDAGGSPMRVTLSVPSGTLAAASGSGVTVTGSGTGTLILEGTQASINAYLASAARPNYVPVANANGSVTLTMTTSDLGNTGTGGTLTDTDTATIAITAVNDAPAGADRTVAIDEDATHTFSAADFPLTDAGDTPPNGLQSVIVTTLPPASQGVLRLNGVAVTAGQAIPAGSLGQLTFTPAANVSGTGLGAFTFQVVDNGGTANGGLNTDPSPNTFSFNIAAVNDAPVAAPDTLPATEDTPLSVPVATLLGNDTDIEGNALTITSVQDAVDGTVSLVGGNVVFTPAPNFNGAASFTYTVSDGNGGTSTATVTVNVAPVNDAPVADDDVASTPINTPLASIPVLADDTDVDGDALTVTAATVDPALGTVTVNPDGTLNFTPATNVSGAVQIGYTVSDGQGGTDTGVLTVNVGANTPPQSADATVSGTEDTPLTLAVANFAFSDADAGQSLSHVRIDTLPASGTLLLNGVAVAAGETIELADIAAGRLVFAPGANGNGATYAGFTFSVQDSGGAFDTAPNTVTFNIAAVNDTPVGTPDTVVVDEDTPATGNVLTNDTDVEGGPLAVTQFEVGGTAFTAGQTATIANVGTLAIGADGSYTFTPAANYNGPVPVATYTVSDGAATASATLTFSVTAVDDAFTDGNETVTANEDTPLTGSVLTGTASVDGPVTVASFGVAGDATTYIAGQTANIASVGTLAINADGSYTFTPVANYNGPVPVVTYSMTDGSSADTSTLVITVAPVDDAFTDADETASTNEDTPLTGSVLTGTTSVDGPVTVASFSVAGDATTYTAGQTANIAGVGTLAINTDGSYTFTPAANYNGPVPVATYTTSDGSSTDTSTLTFNVTPVDDAFTDANETVDTNEDTPLTGSVLTGTASVDGPVTVASFSVAGDATAYIAGQTATIAGVGTLAINDDGSYTFTPVANYNGPVPVATYSLTDGSSGDTSTLVITVVPVDDAFTDTDETASTNEDTPLTGSVLTDTASVDGPVTVASFSVAGDAATYTAGQTATIANAGTLVIHPDGRYIFTPDANYNGPVPVVTYTLTDGSSTDTSTLTIGVTPVDDAFTDADETASTNEDTPLTGSLLTGTTSVDGPVAVTSFNVAGDATTYIAGQTANIAGVGTLAINADGSYTFTPAANYNGPVPVATYTTSDGSSVDTSTLALTVAAVDDAFADANETVGIDEDTPLTGSVLTGTASVDGPVSVTSFTVAGDPVTYTAGETATIAGVGTLAIDADGSYTFTPVANYNGAVPLVTYSLTDGSSGDTSTLAITVAAVDDAFTDADETVGIDEDAPLSGSVLTGTASVDGPVTVTGFTVAGDGTAYTAGQTAVIANVGTLVIDADGSYTFTPAANYNGPVPLVTYSLADGSSGDTSTLAITVASVDDPFTDAGETVGTNEDTPLSGSVLTGTTSVDGPVTVTTFGVAGDDTAYTAGQTATLAGVGTLAIAADGTYAFTPAANYNGPVPVVTYRLTDGSSTGTSTLAIAVAAVDDAFADADETAGTNEDTPLTGSVLAGTGSVDGPVTVTGFSVAGDATAYAAGQTASIAGVGTLAIAADGSYTFTPAANYNGPVPVATYSLTDGSSTDTSTLALGVAAVNDAPVGTPDTGTVAEDLPATGNVLANDTDVDGDALTVTGFSVAGGGTFAAGQTATIAGVGTLAIDADGSYTFTPAANYNGTPPVVTCTVSDGTATATSTLTFTVSATNDAPVNTIPAGWTTSEDTTVGITGLQITDVDAGSGPVRVTLNVASGSLTADSGAGVVVTGSGSETLILEGSQADINAYLASAARPGYVPVANAEGNVTLTMTTSDLGNTGAGGTLTDTDTATLTITPVNDAPSGADRTVTIDEDGAYTFSAADFPIIDGDDAPANGLQSVVVTTLPPASDGVLRLNGVAVTAGQVIPAGSLGQLTFTPAANLNGTGIGAFTFQAVDNGGTGDGGLDTDASPNTFSFDVAAVNDAPVADDDVASTPINTPLADIRVLANDSDADGDPLTVTLATVDPAQGTVGIDPDGALIFTPASNVSGPVQITYTVSDGQGGTDTAVLTVNVGANTPPQSADATANGTEDTPLVLTPANFPFTDADAGQSLANVRIDTLPVEGTLLLDGVAVVAGQVLAAADIAAGRLTFVPGQDGNGATHASLSFSVQDSGGAFGTAPNRLVFDIAPVDDAPVANGDIATSDEDTPVTGNVLANDTDIEGGPLAVTQFEIGGTTFAAGETATIADVGTLAIGADGSYTFTPAANYNGPVPVATYTVSDGAATASATLAFTVAAVNDEPVANDDAASTPINVPLLNLPVLANDTDADGDPLTVTGATVGAGLGTVSVNPDGTLSFAPAANVSGPVQIGYTVSDGKGGTAAAVLTVIVGANTPPQGADTTADGTEDTPLVLTPANFPFTDPDAGQALSGVRIDTLPASGTLLLDGAAVNAGQVISAADIAAGRLAFAPGANGNGAAYASLGFSVQDTSGAFDPAPSTLTFDMAPVNDAPVASAPPAGTPENTPVDGQIAATDADGDALGYTVQQGPAHGTLVLGPDGSYVYTPAADFSGADSFTVVVSDGQDGQTTVTIPVMVSPSNDPPVVVAPPTGTVTAEDTPLAGSLQVADPDGDALGYTVISGPAHGTLAIDPDGSYVYTPGRDFNGADSFTVQMSDGRGGMLTVTVPVTVTPVNDGPSAQPDTAIAANGASVTVDVLGNDTDAEGDPLTVRAIDGTAIAVGGSVAVDGGRVTLNANGTLTFVPNPGFVGTPTFSYTVADSAGSEASGTVRLRVTAAPVPAPAPAPSNGANVQQLLAMGHADLPAGRDTRGEWGREAREPQTMQVRMHIIDAVNGIRPLNGTPALDALGPLRIAVDGIRPLDGTQPLDTPTPVLDLVAQLQHRLQVLDPVQAMFTAQGDARILDVARGNGNAEPDVDALMFSEQIAFRLGQSSAETDQLAAALAARLPALSSVASSNP